MYINVNVNKCKLNYDYTLLFVDTKISKRASHAAALNVIETHKSNINVNKTKNSSSETIHDINNVVKSRTINDIEEDGASENG